ncbi:MAG: HEAT repeat domain-containing protein [Planctomycetota bacterium]|jgi:hypothetical protein
MKTLLIGLIVGGLSGFLISEFVLTEDAPSSRKTRSKGTDSRVEVERHAAEEVDVDALKARIEELEALLKAQPGDDESIFGDVKIPQTEEEIDLLLEEWTATDDIDKLLALIRALLLQGEKGYPKLTKVLMRMVGKVTMGRRYKEEDLLRKVVPALKLAMQHEEELVGYVGYLLTADNIPGVMRTGAMGAAMFLSVNRVRGSERFAPLLMESFMKQGSTGMMGRDQKRMLIEAMGIMKQKEAVDPLLRMLEDPAQKSMHNRAISALGQIGDARAVGPLIQRLQETTPENQWYRPELNALANIGTPEAKAAAENYLAGVENDDQFFNHAGSYLRGAYSDKVVAEAMRRFRKNPAANNMWGVLNGLSRANTPESVAYMEEIAKTSTQQWVKNQAQRYLDERKKIRENLDAAER